MILDQCDIDLVRVDSQGLDQDLRRFRDDLPQPGYEVAKRNREDIPPELSNRAGGEIATKQDQKTGQIKPLNAVYEVIIPIDNPELISIPASAGSPRSTAAPIPSAGGSGG